MLTVPTVCRAGHINNLYNTCFWKLVQEKGLSPAQAQERLKVSYVLLGLLSTFPLSLTVSVFLSLSRSLCVSVCLPFCFSLCLSRSLCVSVFLTVCLCLSQERLKVSSFILFPLSPSVLVYKECLHCVNATWLSSPQGKRLS